MLNIQSLKIWKSVIAMNGSFEDNPCLKFLCNFVLKSMRIKSDKWIKLIATEEYRVNENQNKSPYNLKIFKILLKRTFFWNM